jgi:hypothetical protein
VTAVADLIVHFGNEAHTTGHHVVHACRALGTAVRVEGNAQPSDSTRVAPDTPLLWIESGRPSYPTPARLRGRLSAAWLIDTHLGLDWRGPLAAAFDICFVAQRDAIAPLRDFGVDARWLPLAAPAAAEQALSEPRPLPLSFVVNVTPGSRRARILDAIARELPLARNDGYLAPAAMIEQYRRSRVVVNIPIRTDLNMRLFEAAGAGAYVVTGPMDGLDEILPTALVTVVTTDCGADWVAAVTGALADPTTSEKAAHAAALIGGAHLYTHRAARVIDILTRNAPPVAVPRQRRDGLLRAAVARHAIRDAVRIGGVSVTGQATVAHHLAVEAWGFLQRRQGRGDSR